MNVIISPVYYLEDVAQGVYITDGRIVNSFFLTCAVAFRTTHGQHNTRKCDTEGFLPVASLYGVLGSPSLFI